jgi:DNA-binding NtrC family response regulator
LKIIKTILVVDGNEDTMNVFARILRKRGFAVDLAKDNEDALSIIENDSCDAVLVSLEYSDVGGGDVLFFSKKALPKAKRFLEKDLDALQISVPSAEIGATAIFSKPVAPEKLLYEIEQGFEN